MSTAAFPAAPAPSILYVIGMFTMILCFRRKHRRVQTEEATRRGPEAVARHAEVWKVFEYKSPWTLLGLPLVHVRSGRPYGEKLRPAVGWTAIGNLAIGVLVAVGGIAVGGLSFEALSIGLTALGGFSLGGLACGGLAIGGAAARGFAIGYLAYGGWALAWHAAQGEGLWRAISPSGVERRPRTPMTRWPAK